MIEMIPSLTYEGIEAQQLNKCALEIRQSFKAMVPEQKDRILEDIFDGSWLECSQLLDLMSREQVALSVEQACNTIFLVKAALGSARYKNSAGVYLAPINADIEKLTEGAQPVPLFAGAA